MTELDALDAAWRGFAERIGRAGAAIAGEEFPAGERMRAEGYRYVARLTALATQLYLEFGDPDRPTFFPYGGNTTPFGATNCDNQYLRAFVDPAGTYRLHGHAGGVKELLVSVQDGEMVLGKTAVLHEVSIADLVLDDDGHLDLVVGGARRTGNWMPLGDTAVYLNVRQFIADWEHDPIATLHIDRIDTPDVEAAREPTPASMADALDAAATWVEASVPFWNQYSDGLRSVLPTNELTPPNTPEGGALSMMHGAGRWSLDAGEALVVTFDEPAASYWSVQNYMLGWLQPLDFARRVTSLNDAQVHRDTDGRVRLVIAHEDPGVQNWLDTSRLSDGLVTYRYVRPTKAPAPEAQVVPISSLRDHLPPDTPAFSTADRQAQLAARRRGVDRRYHR